MKFSYVFIAVSLLISQAYAIQPSATFKCGTEYTIAFEGSDLITLTEGRYNYSYVLYRTGEPILPDYLHYEGAGQVAVDVPLQLFTGQVGFDKVFINLDTDDNDYAPAYTCEAAN